MIDEPRARNEALEDFRGRWAELCSAFAEVRDVEEDIADEEWEEVEAYLYDIARMCGELIDCVYEIDDGDGGEEDDDDDEED